MPTYEYVCTSCRNAWEEIQKISEKPIKVCPKCKKPKAQRQISGGNFILKGGGWYADLYSSSKGKSTDANGKSENGAANGDAAQAPKGDAKAAPKGEAKAEAKPATPSKTSSGGGGPGSA
jgi:putative FmdB family regulatory protein